jgi:hypothetical protein
VYQRRLLDEGHAQNMKVMLFRGGYLGWRSVDNESQACTERNEEAGHPATAVVLTSV